MPERKFGEGPQTGAQNAPGQGASQLKAARVRLTRAQRLVLRFAKRNRDDGLVRPEWFRDYRSLDACLKAGVIEFEGGYGEPMYKFTHAGLDALDEGSRG
jgi:hypothetical protein